MIETRTIADCRDCPWEGDPTLRMGLARQAEEHTEHHGHVTVLRTFPVTAQPAPAAGLRAPIRDVPVEPDPPASSSPQRGAQR